MQTDKAFPYHVVTTEWELCKAVGACVKSPIYAADLETTGLDNLTCDIVGVALSWMNSSGLIESAYIPVGHKDAEEQLPAQTVVKKLRALFENHRSVWQNYLYDGPVLHRYDIFPVDVDDTMLMSYALEYKSMNGMDYLALKHLDHKTMKFQDVVKPEFGMETFADVPVDLAAFYAAEDTEVTLDLYYELRKKLQDKDQLHVYEKIDRPQLHAVVEMYENGIGVSKKKLAKLEKKFSAELVELGEDLPIDPLKNREVAAFLYGPKKAGCLGLPVLATTPTGAPKADAETLQKYADSSPVMDDILRFKELHKLQSTYVGPLQTLIRKDTGRLHAQINQTITATARYSGSRPNLQNIPARSPDGKMLRTVFVAPKGRVLVGADYSNIEMRILAHVSQEPALLKLFREGGDQHAETAHDVFGVREGDPKFAEMRGRAKTLNFATVYGITAVGLAAKFGTSVDEAQDILDRFMASRPLMARWIEKQQLQARKRKVKTIFGRQLYPHNERQAVNYVVQGSAADLMRLAMSKTQEALIEGTTAADLMLTVHDELLVECDPREADGVANLLKQRMERAGNDWVDWSVPIVVEPSIGKHWGELK